MSRYRGLRKLVFRSMMLAGAVALVHLIGCKGSTICIGNIGDCQSPAAVSTTTTGSLVVSCGTTQIAVGQTVTCQSTNGTQPFYWSVLTGGVGQIGQTTGIYSSQNAGTATIQATDSSSPALSGSTFLTVH